MSIPRKFQLEEGEKISNWERCTCSNLSEMFCICEGMYDTRTHDSEANDWVISNYKVLRCPSCGEVTIFRYSTSSNILVEMDRSHKHEYGIIEYDREILYSPAKPRHYSIPKAITDVINQAEKVLQISPRAAFILCRAVLEEICRERGILDKTTSAKGKTVPVYLKDRLRLLFEQENMSNDLQEVIDGIKDLGNVSAHGSQNTLTNSITIDEAENLLKLTDHVIERIYIDKARNQEAIEDLAYLKKKVSGLKDKNENQGDMLS